jgi:polysaccharide export outer membrane protein
MTASRIFPIMASFIALAACAMAQDDAKDTPTGFAPASTDSAAVAAAPGGLSRGDTLEISVFQAPDLNREVQVGGTGEISLPLIGVMKAAGKTPNQLESEIAAKLKAKYLQSPQVTVFVKTALGEQVSVSGDVNKPGVFPIVGKMTLIGALAQAGDIDKVGDPSVVLVLRQADGARTQGRFDVSAIRAGKVPDPELIAGDTVVVDRSGSRSAWESAKEVAGPFAAIGTVAAYTLK